jgi:pilus assembly protein FimV
VSKQKVVSSIDKLIRERKYDKAIKELQGLLTQHPEDLRLKLKIAEVYAKKKDNKTAIRMFQEVADAYVDNKFHLKAIAVYKNVLTLNPALVEVNEKLGDLYHDLSMEDDAIQQYQIIAGHYESHGKTQDALRVREKIIGADPSSTTNRLRLAEIYQSEGDADESLKHYEKAAVAFLGKKHKAGLLEAYQKIIHLKPDNPKVALSLFRLYYQKKEFEKIIKTFEKAPGSVQSDDEIHYLAAEAYLRLDQTQEAKKRLKALYEKMLQQQDVKKADYLYGRVRQEFELDDDYFGSIEELRIQAGRPQTSLPETHKAETQNDSPDLEKTGEVNLDKKD